MHGVCSFSIINRNYFNNVLCILRMNYIILWTNLCKLRKALANQQLHVECIFRTIALRRWAPNIGIEISIKTNPIFFNGMEKTLVDRVFFASRFVVVQFECVRHNLSVQTTKIRTKFHSI